MRSVRGGLLPATVSNPQLHRTVASSDHCQRAPPRQLLRLRGRLGGDRTGRTGTRPTSAEFQPPRHWAQEPLGLQFVTLGVMYCVEGLRLHASALLYSVKP